MTPCEGERRTLWLFEAQIPDTIWGTLFLFYAPDEAAARAYTDKLLRRAAEQDQPLHYRHLEPRPTGFSTGKTEWRGSITVYPDRSVVEQSWLRSTGHCTEADEERGAVHLD